MTYCSPRARRPSSPTRTTGSTTELGSVTTSQTYSDFGELSMFEASAGAGLLYREEILTRDGLGRIVDRRETVGGVATDFRYEYDAAGRLWKVFVNSLLQTEYGYDGNGTALTKTSGAVTTGSYDDQDRIEHRDLGDAHLRAQRETASACPGPTPRPRRR